ncbi:MAG: hypothetical protein Kow00107_02680 [Planctomycetota bacterium]
MLKRGVALSIEQIVDITKQVAAALEAAAEQSMVHRDIKPENIMITSKGHVKVADFGLAKVTSAGSNVTREGMILGTVNYMAPEQAKGLECDIRSDLYSLGVVLFRMLTGDVPFKGENLHSIIYKHINEPPPNPLDLNPNIPPVLARICLKLLDKRAERRYQTPRELIRALEGVSTSSLSTAIMDKSDMQTIVDSSSQFVGSASPTEAIGVPAPSRGPKTSRVSAPFGIAFFIMALLLAAFLVDKGIFESRYSNGLLLSLGLITPQPSQAPPPSIQPTPVQSVEQTSATQTPTLPMVAEMRIKVVPENSSIEILNENREVVPVPPAEKGVISTTLKPGKYTVRVFCKDFVDVTFPVQANADGTIEPRSDFDVELVLTPEKQSEMKIVEKFKVISDPDDFLALFGEIQAASIQYPENQVIIRYGQNVQKKLTEISMEYYNKAVAALEKVSNLIGGERYVDLEAIDLSEIDSSIEASLKYQSNEDAKKLKADMVKFRAGILEFVAAQQAEDEALQNQTERKSELMKSAFSAYSKFSEKYSAFEPLAGLVRKSTLRAEKISKGMSDRDRFITWLSNVQSGIEEVKALIAEGSFPEAEARLAKLKDFMLQQKPRIQDVDAALAEQVKKADQVVFRDLPEQVERGLRNRKEIVWERVESLEAALKARDIDAFSQLLAEGPKKAALVAELKAFFAEEMVESVALENAPEGQPQIGNDSAKLSLLWSIKVTIRAEDGSELSSVQKINLLVGLRYVDNRWLIVDIEVPAKGER